MVIKQLHPHKLCCFFWRCGAVTQHTENTFVLLFTFSINNFDKIGITLRLEQFLGKIAMFVWCKKAGILATFISSEIVNTSNDTLSKLWNKQWHSIILSQRKLTHILILFLAVPQYSSPAQSFSYLSAFLQ